MPKRKRSDDVQDLKACLPKRTRTGFKRNLLHLSDEILLRILSHLTVTQLTRVERVSHRLRQLAIDSELWKSRFYETWVSARARRRPLLGRPRNDESSYSAKLAKWLEHGQLLRDGVGVDWKRQYKVRSNWSAGVARIQEVEIANPSAPPVLAKVHSGMIFTVDAFQGLRAWSQKQGSKQLHSQFQLETSSQPTSVAVDGQLSSWHIAVGFDDGRCAILKFCKASGFEHVHWQADTGSDSVLSIALAMPYLLVMTRLKDIQLYRLTDNKLGHLRSYSSTPIAALHSDVSFQPCSLSLRIVQDSVIATIVYAFSRIQAGWCVGLQEVRVSDQGGLLRSRLTSTIETPSEAQYRGQQRWELSSRSASSAPFALHPQLMSAPTSLSYAHPYLIASLSDNTLMSYIVTSDNQKLEINSGRRLWGHTSAVSDAEVSNRGKAVSVSTQGDDMRVWELEEFLTTIGRRSHSTPVNLDASFEISKAVTRRGNGLGLALSDFKKERVLTKNWVGFDEEQVVVLGERDTRQIMACYDFT